MDWQPVIGRTRPLEQDALRILSVVHQLGEATDLAGFHRRITGESRLQHLDHLVRRPVDLAYVLIDQFPRHRRLRARKSGLMRRVRRLVAGEEARHHRFHLGPWERWDDVLAFLGCRNLLRVEAAAEGGLRYLLTDTGARLLEERIYPSEKRLAPFVERCRLLRDFLPHFQQAPLAELLGRVASRLERFGKEEQISPEDDFLGALFQNTFGEHL